MSFFTPLTADQIEFRVQSTGTQKNGNAYATVIPYKDARADMEALDTMFTPYGWQKKYELINGQLFCHVGILHPETKEWVWKSDVGTESNQESVKGQASDAFKRACFNIGIGRELYNYPTMFIALLPDEVTGTDKKGNPKPNYKFLKGWRWENKFDNNKLVSLKAWDKEGKQRYNYSI